MSATLSIHDPTAPCDGRTEHERRRLSDLKGKVIGFIDNGKPNFHFLVDDLAQRLVARYGVVEVKKHRKRGSVPVTESVLKDYAENCDAVITGSGD